MNRCPLIRRATSTPPDRPSRRGRSAFTLVDLTLTLLILGILAATVVPRFSAAVLYYQVDGAARRVEADINYVQRCTATRMPPAV